MDVWNKLPEIFFNAILPMILAAVGGLIGGYFLTKRQFHRKSIISQRKHEVIVSGLQKNVNTLMYRTSKIDELEEEISKTKESMKNIEKYLEQVLATTK